MSSILMKAGNTRVLIIVATIFNLFACADSSAKNVTRQTQVQQKLREITLYDSTAITSFNIVINSSQIEKVMSGKHTQIRNGNVSISKIDKDAQADAVLLTFKNESQSGLYISSDNLDLSAYYEPGAIEFDRV